MLVLASTYQHQNLRHYIPREKLLTLLDRTIGTLNRLAPISQTCRADCWILRRIRNSMFPGAEIHSSHTLSGGLLGPTPPGREGSCDSEIVVAPQNAAGLAPSVDSAYGSQAGHWT